MCCASQSGERLLLQATRSTDAEALICLPSSYSTPSTAMALAVQQTSNAAEAKAAAEQMVGAFGGTRELRP